MSTKGELTKLIGVAALAATVVASARSAAASTPEPPAPADVRRLMVPDSAESRTLASVVWAGAKQALSVPASGVVEVDGESFPGRPFQLTNAFDDGGELTRVDLPAANGAAHYITNATSTYYMRDRMGTVMHFTRDADEFKNNWLPVPFDWRLFGICTTWEIVHQINMRRFEAKVINISTCDAVEETGGGFRFAVSFAAPEYRLLRVVWFRKDFMPVRATCWAYFAGPKSWRHEWTSEVARSRVGGAEVPIGATTVDENRGTKTAIRCTWKSVNSGVDRSIFELGAMDAPRGAIVVDRRAPVEFVESVVGGGRREPAAGLPKASPWRVVVIALNAIVVAILVYVFYRRRRQLGGAGPVRRSS